jgi:predicted P-type ATPase
MKLVHMKILFRSGMHRLILFISFDGILCESTEKPVLQYSNFGFSSPLNLTVPEISFGPDSLGYTLSIVYIVLLISLYGIYWFSRLIRSNNLRDNKMYLPDFQMTQKGFVHSRFGAILQVLTYLFVLWLHVAMVMAIIGHYQDQWPFDLSLDKGSVDWDSFTRVFISTWTSSIIVAIFTRIFRHRMDSFYLRPASLSVATHIKLSQVVTDESNPEKSLSVLHEEVVEVGSDPVRHVWFLLKKLAWSESDGMFVSGINDPVLSELKAIKERGGMSNGAASDRLKRFGRNEIRISVPSFWSMVGKELSTSFFLYQIYFGCLLSLYWDYISAGILCFILIVSSASIKVYMERKEQLLLRDIATMHGSVWVKRDEHWTRVTCEELVAGDLICVSDETFDVCKEVTVDCVLVSGSAVVDESVLTGETMPVQKHALLGGTKPVSIDDPEMAKHCLFAGTWLLQSSDASDAERPGSVSSGALAVVLRTGGSTIRGDLMKCLLYGNGQKSYFFSEFRVAISFLVILAGINFWIVDSARSLTMASILPAISSLVGLVSPLLTVALIGGEVRSAGRLKKIPSGEIRVKEVHKLTDAGRTDLVLLDKSGTITKKTLEYRGVVPAASLQLAENSLSVELGVCLALAHSVTRVNGALVGHQVELQMVEAASRLGWKFGTDVRAPTDPAGNVWEVEKMYPFSHTSMTMSALVVQKSTNQRLVVCKGSFEALQSRCTDISEEIARASGMYAQDGYYMLSVGMKTIESQEDLGASERDDLEKNLKFQGFIVYKNDVKADSASVIDELKRSGIRVGIVSGDSVFTSSAVARTVGILPSNAKVVIGVIGARTKQIEWRLADTDSRISEEALSADPNAVLCITGEVFETLKSDGKLELDRTWVYGRMSPNQKAEIVQLYTDKGRNVLMVGDGSNDVAALKTANGLAINALAEANVAAPFSTANESLTTIISLLKEARCALTTSLSAYKFLVSVGLIQTLTKTLLYLQCAGFISGVASLFIDCIQIPVLLYCICSATPEKNLANTPPRGSLMGPDTVLGISWTVLIGVICIGIAEAVMINGDFFIPFHSDAPISSWRERTDSFESALVVLLRIWLFTDIAVVYSYGHVHRRGLLTNWRLVIGWIFFAGLVGYLMFGPVGVPQAAFIVQIDKATSIDAGATFFNNFLFYYERIGGVWYGITDSIEFPLNFRFALVSIMVLSSMFHHLGYRLGVLGPLTRWCKERLGWIDGSCGCCRRNRFRGYRPLGIQITKIDALDESINQAGELDSPASEWELRRTYGKWRAPAEPVYK